jgi:hypothetical protein
MARLKNVEAQHPPHQEQRDYGDDDVAHPLAGGLRFSAVLHEGIIAGCIGEPAYLDRKISEIDLLRATLSGCLSSWGSPFASKRRRRCSFSTSTRLTGWKLSWRAYRWGLRRADSRSPSRYELDLSRPGDLTAPWLTPAQLRRNMLLPRRIRSGSTRGPATEHGRRYLVSLVPYPKHTPAPCWQSGCSWPRLFVIEAFPESEFAFVYLAFCSHTSLGPRRLRTTH